VLTNYQYHHGHQHYHSVAGTSNHWINSTNSCHPMSSLTVTSKRLLTSNIFFIFCDFCIDCEAVITAVSCFIHRHKHSLTHALYRSISSILHNCILQLNMSTDLDTEKLFTFCHVSMTKRHASYKLCKPQYDNKNNIKSTKIHYN